jgi:hypothetical protein
MSIFRRKTVLQATVVLFMLTASGNALKAQDIRFGVFADPMISWFSSDTKVTSNEGSRAGFNFGFTFNRYFSKNYSFSSGLSLLSAGGSLHNSDTLVMYFNNYNAKVSPGQAVNYRIQYLDIPIGLKFESNQIGYITFFTDLGIDAKIRVSGKVDIPSLNISKETATKEISPFAMSYHIMTGIEYSLGGNTEVVLGIGYENNFIDVTRDLAGQPKDRITQNLIRFRLGFNF